MDRYVMIRTTALKEMLEKVDKEYTIICIDKGNNLILGSTDETPERKSVFSMSCKIKGN
jgi:hypothetical protein